METTSTDVNNIVDTLVEDNKAHVIRILEHQNEMYRNDLVAANKQIENYRNNIDSIYLELADEVKKNEILVKELNRSKNPTADTNDSEYAYYYVAYTVNEYGKLETVPKYFHSIDDAKEEMKFHSNFYEARGTGYIYGVKFTVPVETVCVFEK